MDNVVKLKNLMVSACASIREGNKDIGLNLLEVAADIMENVDPEVIETQFITKGVNATPENTNSAGHDLEEMASEEEDVSTEQPEEMHEEVATQSFRDVISGWNLPNARAV